MGKRIQRVDIDKMNTKMLELGYQDENIHTQVQIDCSSVLWDYPNATAKMTVQAPNGEKYPVVPELADNVVIWDVTDSDLVYAGSGKIQLTLKNGTEVIKSASCSTRIMESITTTGPAPTPLENWMQRAEETAEQIAETAAETVLEDYGTVKEDVTGLKSALDDNYDIVVNGLSPVIGKTGFEKGSMTDGVNDNYRKASRARSVNIEHNEKDVYILSDYGWVVAVIYFDSNGDFQSATSFVSMAHIESGSYYRLLLTKADATDATQLDLDVILSHFRMPNEINNAAEDVDIINDYFSTSTKTLPSSRFLNGGLDGSGAIVFNFRRDYRAVSVIRFHFPVACKIIARTGFKFLFAEYLENDDFVSISDNWETVKNVPSDTYFRIMIATAPETTSGARIPVETLVDGIGIEYLYKDAELTNSVRALQPDVREFESDLFEHGTIDGSGGNATWRQNYRARSKTIKQNGYAINVTARSGYMFAVATYDSEGGFLELTAWLNEYVIPAGAHYRLMIATRPETTTGAEIPVSTLVSGIAYTSAYASLLDNTANDYGRYNVLLPSYYESYLPTKIESIRDNAKRNGVSFVFITDTHVEVNAGKSPALIKYINAKTNCVPFVIFGGDVVMDRATIAEVKQQGDKWVSWVNAMGVNRVFQCIGNHDYHGLVSEDGSLVNYGLNQNLVYNFVMGRQLFYVNAEYGKKYYYFDVRPAKTRVIVLDCYDTNSNEPNMMGYTGVSTEQLQWLANTAFANMGGYHVICISHETFDTQIGGSSTFATIFSLIKAFANKTTFESGTVSADFTQDTNEFVMLLSGHAHVDKSNTSDGVLSVVTTCDARYTGVNIDQSRVVGTTSEQAFDVFSVDYDSKTIKTTRIGYGSDREWTY